MGFTKVLREKVPCRSLSSAHIDYKQAIVGGLSDTLDPARQIGNLQPYGGINCIVPNSAYTYTHGVDEVERKVARF